MKKKQPKLLWVDEAKEIPEETFNQLMKTIDKLPKDKIQIVSSPTRISPFYKKFREEAK